MARRGQGLGAPGAVKEMGKNVGGELRMQPGSGAGVEPELELGAKAKLSRT